MVFAIAACILGSVLYAFRKGHLLWAAFLGLFGAYELCGPLLQSGIFGEEVVTAQRELSGASGNAGIQSFSIGLFVFFLLANAVYAYAFRVIRLEEAPRRQNSKNYLESNYFLLAFILFCGLVSNYYKAGETRLLDYGIESLIGGLPTTPMFSYGATMLVLIAMGCYSGILRAKWKFAILCALGAIPLMVELFISSRRQYFAPSVAAVLLLIYYSRELKNKLTWAGSIILGALLFLGVQFWVRNEFIEGSSASGFFEKSIAPQLGEFVAIGTTSIKAWDQFILGNAAPTYGVHLGYQALNCIPFVKVGSILWPTYGDQLAETSKILAPWGGLSLLAEAFWAFGVLGIPILAVLVGTLLAFTQKKLNQCVEREELFSIQGAYLIALSTTLILKYRSGLSDMIQTVINFTLLYVFIGLGQAVIRQARGSEEVS